MTEGREWAMPITFETDPLQDAVNEALLALEEGRPVVERERIDLKEEAGRRGHGGAIQPGARANPAAAEHLADECACMANTPGGGALLVGVADDGTLIGTDLDEQWLRSRLYDILQRMLTVEIRPVLVNGVRLLVIFVPAAVEPIRRRNKIFWRVHDRCVEMDAATWHERRYRSLRLDWSGQASHLPAEAVRATAVEVVRDFLRASGDPSAQELAEDTTPALLRRLNAVTGEGFLTNAAALMFVGRNTPALDYIHRNVTGGDSTDRVNDAQRSVVEQLQLVFTTARANNPVVVHAGTGLARGQVRQIPERALREAIVNAVAHREWHLSKASVVEHVGGILRVTSPGGFFGGVSPANIINHPSESRNSALTELLAAIKVAEREGVGVDRMYGEMLRLGYPLPEIDEIDGPSVTTTLVADRVDQAWMAWLEAFDDSRVRDDLRLLMSLHLLVERGWLDTSALAPYLQLSPSESQVVLNSLTELVISGKPLLTPVLGVPDSQPQAWALSVNAREAYLEAEAAVSFRRTWPSRKAVARSYAQHRGRISSTELGSLVGAAASNVGRILLDLEQEGILEPSRSVRRGPYFYYRWRDAP